MPRKSREETREYFREWQRNNREKVRAYNLAYYYRRKEDPEGYKKLRKAANEWNRKNKQSRAALSKRWRQKNAKRRAEYMREFRLRKDPCARVRALLRRAKEVSDFQVVLATLVREFRGNDGRAIEGQGKPDARRRVRRV